MDKTRNKLAIVGFAEATRMMAPFDNDEYEIWGLNHLYPFIPRWDRWFELHDPGWMADNLKIWKEYDEWLRKEHPFPIYMHKHFDEYPSSVEFPLDELVKKYGSYFTSSIALMLGLGIAMGFEQIEIYGVDMAHDSEWGIQRPCVEYWIGIARGLGIKVGLPSATALLSNEGIYGYNDAAVSREFREFETYLQEHIKDVKNKRQEAIATAHAADGALQAFEEVLGSLKQKIRGRSFLVTGQKK